MFQDIRISPSILSCDFTRLGDELSAIEQAGADWVHFDVMDGHFVPNLSVGVPVLKQVRSATHLPLDVHLMVSNPLEQLPWFLACNPNYVTIHWEAFPSSSYLSYAKSCIDLARDAGVKIGVAIKPDTPVDVLADTLSLWDMILIMSVFPGFSGQSFIPESAARIDQLSHMCSHTGVAPLIQVDGGIDSSTAPCVVQHGADILVAGNAVFKAPDYAMAISSIRSASAEMKG